MTSRLNGRGRASLLCAGLLLVALVFAAESRAATLQLVGTFNNPRDMRSDPEDPDRLFVVERAGRVQLRNAGTSTEILNISSLVGTSHGEEGLLSIELSESFATNGLFYLFYTTPDVAGTNSIQVDQYHFDGTVAAPASRRPIITIPHTSAGNHNGGQLHFGPDGYLYISIGDGAAQANGQNTTNMMGSVLRIDPDETGLAAAYSIPDDNPYVGSANDPMAGTPDEIWSWGLRNPWRYSFDSLNGAFVLTDVGEGNREEINYRTGATPGRGDNFGWSCREGTANFNPGSARCLETVGTWVEPTFDYPHSAGRCSITGGYVVRDQSVPELYGRYIYADYCVSGELRSVVLSDEGASGDRSETAIAPFSNVVSFGEDSCDRVYVITGNGQVNRIVGASPADCDPEPSDDTTPPVVSAALNPLAPDGDGGWYRTAPALTINADDGPDGSGVASVVYRVNGGAPQAYTGPVTLNRPDGGTTIEYVATDVAGNPSETATIGFDLDRTAPVSTVDVQVLSGDDCPDFGADGFCPVRVSMSSDDAGDGSGTSGFHFSVVPAGTTPTFDLAPFALPIDVTEQGEYTVHFFARDIAGNVEAVKSRPLVVDSLLPTLTVSKSLKRLAKNNPVFKVACPAAALAPCPVSLAAKVKPKVKFKGTKKQKKAARKAARKGFKVKGGRFVQPGASVTYRVVVPKSSCKKLRVKKMKMRFKLAIGVSVPGGDTYSRQRSDKGMFCR